jgi:thiamine-monophosphate kinase
VGELARIKRLAALFGIAATEDLELGIGDDAAVILPSGEERLVWTVDTQIEGQHFRLGWLSFLDLGYRSFVAAASDVSAMGGSPWLALSALSLSSATTEDDMEQLARGQKEASEATGARVVGGNLSKAAIVTVTTTVLGKVVRPLTRSGARVGDGVWVAGELGLAAAGLRALERADTAVALDAAVHAWRRPTPRVAEGLAMTTSAHAAIDVSDGLATDVARIAEASQVEVVLDRRLLLARATDSLARASHALGIDPFALILGGGEDYALVATSTEPVAGFSRVGEVREGHGVVVRTEEGDERLRDLPGFDHFR